MQSIKYLISVVIHIIFSYIITFPLFSVFTAFALVFYNYETGFNDPYGIPIAIFILFGFLIVVNLVLSVLIQLILKFRFGRYGYIFCVVIPALVGCALILSQGFLKESLKCDSWSPNAIIRQRCDCIGYKQILRYDAPDFIPLLQTWYVANSYETICFGKKTKVIIY